MAILAILHWYPLISTKDRFSTLLCLALSPRRLILTGCIITQVPLPSVFWWVWQWELLARNQRLERKRAVRVYDIRMESQTSNPPKKMELI